SPLRRLDGRAHSPRGPFDRPNHRRALRADPCWSPIACWRRTTDGRELLLSRYTEPQPELNLLLKKTQTEAARPTLPKITARALAPPSLLQCRPLGVHLSDSS